MKAKQTLLRHCVILLAALPLTYLFLVAHSNWAPMLVVLHTAYFLFMHFLHFYRPLPDPAPLRWSFIGLVVAVITLQSIVTVRTWRIRRHGVLRDSPKHVHGGSDEIWR